MRILQEFAEKPKIHFAKNKQRVRICIASKESSRSLSFRRAIVNLTIKTKNATSDHPKRQTGNERRGLCGATAFPQERCCRTLRPLPAGPFLTIETLFNFILVLGPYGTAVRPVLIWLQGYRNLH